LATNAISFEVCGPLGLAAWDNHLPATDAVSIFYSFPTGGNEHGRRGSNGAAHFLIGGIFSKIPGNL
jgi:hypothetical protein